MIVVVGCPGYSSAEGEARGTAVGISADIARRAVAAGSSVELVGKIGDDAAGDALVLALAADGIGHAALLRDPAHGTPLASGQDGPDDDEDDTLVLEDDVRGGDGLLPEDGKERPAVDPADLSLALRYLTDYRVLVAAEPLDAARAEVVAEAATFAGAYLVVVAHGSSSLADSLAAATVFEAPAADPDGAFATVVGRYAASLDQGAQPEDAFAGAVSAAGWQPVEA